MNIGIIGTGAIGLPIAERIIGGGIKLNFYARRGEVKERLVNLGADFFSDAGKLGAHCDAVLLFVNTYYQCLDCVESLLSTMRSGGIILVGSTISPKQMNNLYEMCDKKGIRAVASPVTGGVKGACEGTLTIILSGVNSAIKEITPCLETFGSHLYNLGEKIELAHTMKSLVQLLVGINTAATSEALVLGSKCGLKPEDIFEVVGNSAGVSKIFSNRAPTIISRDFSKRGTIDILYKDLKISNELALDTNVPLFLGNVCSKLFGIGAQTLDGEQDFSAIVKLYEQWSNFVVGKNDLTEEGESEL